MKKAMANHLLRFFAGMFILFGTLMMTASRADAQGLDQTIGQSQNLNWVSEAEAMVTLDAQLITLANQLANLPQGSQAYKDVLNHLTYYKLIYSDIETGATTTMLATNGNIYNVSSANGIKDASATPINLGQLYSDAVGLLTN
jgi:hypothetical protein